MRIRDWYFKEAGAEVAARFVEAVEWTVRLLTNTREIGQRRFQDHPLLAGVRSHRLMPPFVACQIFYRETPEVLVLARIVHGRRDLPRGIRGA